MDEQTNIKLALYKEYNQSMEKFKAHNFATNRFYAIILMIILLIILLAKQIFIAGSLLITFGFSFFGLCMSVIWVISQDTYANLISIKIGKVLEEMEKEMPVKPYTLEHKEIIKFKDKKRIFSFDNMQNFLALAMAVIFTVLFFSEIVPFCMLVKAFM